jgi:hypothetical protein
MVEIPLKPKKPTPDATAATNGAIGTGKRKREGSSPGLEPGGTHDTKRLASASVPDSSGNEATVIDDEEGGKRKREGSSADLELGTHDAKRLANASVPDSSGIEAIIIDDEDGAIMIED